MAEGRAVPAVALRGLAKDTAAGRRVLHPLDLELAPGRLVALMGANGAGKSTLLDLVCGLTRPSAGQVRVFGVAPREAVQRGWLGAMLQDGGLLPELTVAETVRAVAALHRRRVGLAGLDPVLAAIADRRVGACSGGERQRLKWALAVLGEPRLLVLDEPTAGMDWQARADFWQQVARLRGQGVTVLYASHYADEVDQVADELVLLHHGRLVARSTPDEVRALGRVPTSTRNGHSERASAPESPGVAGAALFAGLSRLLAEAADRGSR